MCDLCANLPGTESVLCSSSAKVSDLALAFPLVREIEKIVYIAAEREKKTITCTL